MLAAARYFVDMLAAGRHFGIKDRDHLPILDVGFRFHLATYLIHNAVSYLWFALGFNSRLENISRLHYTLAIWGFLLLVHFFAYPNAGKTASEAWTRRSFLSEGLSVATGTARSAKTDKISTIHKLVCTKIPEIYSNFDAST